MTAMPVALRIPKVRWGIGVLLGAGVLVNYFDRINLSVGGPQLQQDFGLTDSELGWLFSGLFWPYAVMQIPTGMILDRFGVTPVNRLSTFLWSVASTATAFASGFGGILAARVLLGAAEAPSFPASSKATGYWFPRQERSLATSIFDAAAKFSNVIGIPLVALVVVQFRSGGGALVSPDC
jgi:ACS family D-galactonate transporter-like MFS transporter